MQLNDRGLLQTLGFIDGQWCSAEDGSTFAVSNPATQDVIANVADMKATETRNAICAAEQAQKPWAARSAKERCDIIERWYDLMMAAQEDLAVIMTTEQGKPLAESRGEVAYGASYLKWFSEEGKRIYGDIIPQTPDRRGLVIKQPVGVVAAITPWNFPNAMIARKVAPALAAGCTVVLKPAAETPLSALAMAELGKRAGLPDGVFNIVTGLDAAAIGGELTSNPVVRKLTFTGSTPVGKLLMKQCADTVKRTSMELGGNAPVIVFDDADLERAIDGAIAAKYRNSGQTCICSNRLLVQSGIYDAFVEKFSARVAQFNVGNGLQGDTTHGPLITVKAVNEVHAKVQDAVAGGAQVVIGGQPGEQGEQFYQPTVLTHVNSSMRVFREEIFGPVAPVFKFDTEDDAIAMANDTEFGLASYLYSENMGRIFRVSEALEYGMVGVNETAISSELIPFGGVKESGQGREGSLYGLDDYLETKYICLGGMNRA